LIRTEDIDAEVSEEDEEWVDVKEEDEEVEIKKEPSPEGFVGSDECYV